MPPSVNVPTAVALGLVLAVAGCGSEKDSGQLKPRDTINFGSFGTTADIDCAQGKSLNVGGSNNTLKVVGTCASVNVGGADNTITIVRVDGELTVDGLNNSVSYQSGDPEVTDSGSGNRIKQG